MTWNELSITVEGATLYVPYKNGLSWDQVVSIIQTNAEDGGLDRACAITLEGKERHWSPEDSWSAMPPEIDQQKATTLDGRRIAADPIRNRLPGTYFLGYGIILYGVNEDYRCRFYTQNEGYLDVTLKDSEIILLPDTIEMNVSDDYSLDVTSEVLDSRIEDLSSLRDGPADECLNAISSDGALNKYIEMLGSKEIKVVQNVADYFGISSTVDLCSGGLMLSETDLKSLLDVFDQAKIVHNFINSYNNENELGNG